jgi:hypothetical protein
MGQLQSRRAGAWVYAVAVALSRRIVKPPVMRPASHNVIR